MFAKYQITTFCAPPTMYRMLIKQDLSRFDLSSIQHASIAGEALNPEVFRQFEKATGMRIMEGFGQSESTLIIGNLAGDSHKIGSMGKPVPLYDVHLLDSSGHEAEAGDTGEICINIQNGIPCGLAYEYYNSPEVTAKTWHDGFYHTGDLAWRDEDGFYWYVGRADDVIKSSGYRIGPFEIENVIMELPYVLECGVSAAPDEIRGQVVKASIVLVKGTEGTDALKKKFRPMSRRILRRTNIPVLWNSAKRFQRPPAENHQKQALKEESAMTHKRLTLFAGHYGSGKTNIALNYARWLRRKGEAVTVADLDIVNPYFRTKDSEEDLKKEGIGLIVSPFANSNLDVPAMPKETYALIAERGECGVLDIGGDDRGALALGRYVPEIRAEGDYEMLFVINRARPLTRTVADTILVLREIEAACGLPFTAVVNNTNLGQATAAADVLSSMPYAEAVAARAGLPLKMTCCAARLCDALRGSIPNLFPMEIQKLYYQLR